MSKKIKFYSKLKSEQQVDVKNGIDFGVLRVQTILHKEKMYNAVIFNTDVDDILVFLDDNTFVDSEDDDNEDFDD